MSWMPKNITYKINYYNICIGGELVSTFSSNESRVDIELYYKNIIGSYKTKIQISIEFKNYCSLTLISKFFNSQETPNLRIYLEILSWILTESFTIFISYIRILHVRRTIGKTNL